MGKSLIGSTPNGTPKPLLAPSPGMVPPGSGGNGGIGEEVELETLKAMYDSALLQQQQHQILTGVEEQEEGEG